MQADNRVIGKMAVASSFALAGGFSVVSLMAIPSFMLVSSQTAAQQFASIYRIGYITQPPLTVLTALAHGIVAYRLHLRSSDEWKHWASSGALIGAILPWTFGLMEPVSHQLLDLGKINANQSGKSLKEASVYNLLRKWSVLNSARSLMAIGGGAIALYFI